MLLCDFDLFLFFLFSVSILPRYSFRVHVATMEKTELKILLNHGTVLAEAFFRFVSYRLESYAGNVSKCGKSESRNRASTRLAHSFFLAALLGVFPLLYCSLTCTAFNSLFLRG